MVLNEIRRREVFLCFMRFVVSFRFIVNKYFLVFSFLESR